MAAMPVRTGGAERRRVAPGLTNVHTLGIADVDGDERPDVLVLDRTPGDAAGGVVVSILRNLGGGGLAECAGEPPIPGDAVGFMLVLQADLDGDGVDDLLWDLRGVSTGPSAAAMLRSGDGVSPPVWVSMPDGTNLAFCRVADLDGNGRPELITLDYATGRIFASEVMPRGPGRAASP